ncbi:MAG TPA: hypothetical protein PLW34_10015 [Termitinemataceae bacterium]|nr:hypothetical protein [Termitinemataceae bacterium]HOM24121.1 hypothetical protein [Termitinemataceae bacterium]HPQ01112.1 hypothetical protein [Termitinemataceae bacterium]
MKKYVLLFWCIIGVGLVFSMGKREGDTPEVTLMGSAEMRGIPRVLSVYTLALTKNEDFNEQAYLAPSLMAYVPVQFSYSGDKRRFEYPQNGGFRILKREKLDAEIQLYTVELYAQRWEMLAGKVYRVIFSRDQLGPPQGEALQPAMYAIERAVRLSGCKKGYAQIQSLTYDEKNRRFTAEVIVSAS